MNEFTAVQWLDKAIRPHLNYPQRVELSILLQQAIEIEKQQIIRDYDEGFLAAIYHTDGRMPDGTNYYRTRYLKNE